MACLGKFSHRWKRLVRSEGHPLHSFRVVYTEFIFYNILIAIFAYYNAISQPAAGFKDNSICMIISWLLHVHPISSSKHNGILLSIRQHHDPDLTKGNHHCLTMYRTYHRWDVW